MTKPNATSLTAEQAWATVLTLWTSKSLPTPIAIRANSEYRVLAVRLSSAADLTVWADATGATIAHYRSSSPDGEWINTQANGTLSGDWQWSLSAHEAATVPVERAELDAALSATATALGEPS